MFAKISVFVAMAWGCGAVQIVEVEHVNKNCSNACAVDDANSMPCFHKTLHYYDRMVVVNMHDWLAVLDNIEQWHWRHTTSYPGPNKTQIAASAIERWKKFLVHEPLIEADTLGTVAKAIVDKIQTAKVTEPPNFACPISCDYRTHLWQYMFIASACLNAALFLAVVPFMINSLRQDKKLEH